MSAAARPAAARGAAASLPGALVRPGASTTVAAPVTTPSESPTQLAIRRFRENTVAMVALVVFIGVIALSFSGPLVERWAGRNYTEQNLTGSVTLNGKKVEVVNLEGSPQVGPGPHRQYLLGADALGRDVFVRMVRGGSVSLRVGIMATAMIIALGTLIGLVGGYYGGRVDKVMQYVVDVMMAFPAMLFMIAVSATVQQTGKLGPLKSSSILIPTIMLGFFGAFGFSRYIRSNAKELAAKDYVEAARALGGDDRRIMFVHMLPHLFPLIITYAGILLAGCILGEAGMSFLGFGVQPPTPSWGNLINDGRDFYSTAWWIAGAGGFMVVLTVLCSNLIGEGLEEALDPKAGR